MQFQNTIPLGLFAPRHRTSATIAPSKVYLDPAGKADPHVAGRNAQAAYLKSCEFLGLQSHPAELDRRYWEAYKAVMRAQEGQPCA